MTVPVTAANSLAFGRFAAGAAFATAAAGVGYAIAFVVADSHLFAALFVTVSGVLVTPVLIALHQRLRAIDPGFAAWAVGLTVAGALGSAVHGGYDLANAVHPPAKLPTDLPNAVDPRGLLTFGVSGIGIFALGLLITRAEGRFPRRLGHLGLLTGALLVLLYVGRLVVLDANSPWILGPAALAGFVVLPSLYARFGLYLLRADAAPAVRLPDGVLPELGRV